MPSQVIRSIGKVVFKASAAVSALSFATLVLCWLALGLSYQTGGGYGLRDMHRVFDWACFLSVIAFAILGSCTLGDLAQAMQDKLSDNSNVDYKAEALITFALALVAILSFVGRDMPAEAIWVWLKVAFATMIVSVFVSILVGLIMVMSSPKKAKELVDVSQGG